MQQSNIPFKVLIPEVLSKDQVRQLIAEFAASEVLDTEQAAAYLKVSTQLLELMRVRGDGPKFSRLGGNRLIRYRRASLDEWVMFHERTSTADIPTGAPSG